MNKLSEDNNKRWVIEGAALGLTEIQEFGFDDLRKAINLHEHSHSDSFEFVYIEHGRASWETDCGHFETRAGDVFHTRPNERHRGGYNIIEPFRFWWFTLNIPPANKEQRRQSNWLQMNEQEQNQLLDGLWNLQRVIHVGPHLIGHFRRMKRALQKGGDLSNLEVKVTIIDFMLNLMRPESNDFLPDDLNRNIQQLINRMETNPDWSPRLHELAKLVNVSPSYFHRIFQTCTGLTPKSYLDRIKIAEANRLLKDSDLSVMEISLRLGYATTQHFATVFRRMMGQSPTQWRYSERLDMSKI